MFPEITNLGYYIIGYKHNHNIKPLHIKLPEYICSANTFKKNITISSEINDADFFYEYNKIMGINVERNCHFVLISHLLQK